jgi:hypothetical protein
MAPPSTKGTGGVWRVRTRVGGPRFERYNVQFVRVPPVAHCRVAEHAVQTCPDHVHRLGGLSLRLRLCLSMLVDVRHGRNGIAARASTCEGTDSGRPRG